MTRALSLLLGSALLAAVPAQAAPDKAELRAKHEAELAEILKGRVAGEPVDCIDLHRVTSSRIVDGTAIVYDAGRTLYVNRPRSGAESLDDWDILVTRTHGNRLCSIDTVELRDRSSQFFSGVVFLDEFVPYRKVESASAD